ncbi:Tyrosine recombinase XerD [termite gut metagenome]|uniref:Tyrosine recombinase XerD n=1 Tax=termite gut metagenome TaxID=433724 RepID=A0A5J4QNP5_9ZZZZ
MKTIRFNKSSYKDFANSLDKFFTEYLAVEQRVSKHTIRSYRDTFILLLDYLKNVRNKPADKLEFIDFNRELILAFLKWLQDQRLCSSGTRNQRLAAIKSFFCFMIYEDPIHIAEWKTIYSIKQQKQIRETVRYLTIEGIKCLLEQIPTNEKEGWRNLTMLSLLYNTGMRVSELTGLTPACIRFSKPYIIEVFGKGAKKRLVPVEENMMKLLGQYMEENRLNRPGREDQPLFFNCHGGELTPAGITYVLKKYAALARIINPSLIPDKISPHNLRTSRAMHWLQAGIEIYYIRDLLGHVSVQTTEIYARTDSKSKREALEKAYAVVGITEPEITSWEKNPKLVDFLKSLA